MENSKRSSKQMVILLLWALLDCRGLLRNTELLVLFKSIISIMIALSLVPRPSWWIVEE